MFPLMDEMVTINNPFKYSKMRATETTINIRNVILRTIACIAFGLSLSFVAVFAFRKPHYNWDMLAYIAIVIKAEHPEYTPGQVHTATYQTALQEIPKKSYEQLTDSSNTYRRKMMTGAIEFNNQLPFYAVKPLYTGMVYLFHSTGFSLSKSTVLPSILSYFLIGLLLVYWLRSYLSLPIACMSSLLIMTSSMAVGVTRNSTPDCLSALLLLTALYCIIEKFSPRILAICLLLSILARIDNIITGFFLLSFLLFYKHPGRQISLKYYLALLFIFSFAYFCISIYAINSHPDWSVFYYSKFMRYLDSSHEYHQNFSWRSYLALVYAHIFTALVSTHFSLFAFLVIALIGIPKFTRQHHSNFDQHCALLLLTIILARFLLFPDLDDRFNIAFYLAILVLTVKTVRVNILKN